MKIVIDARYLASSYSGIATYSRHLLTELAKIDDANEYTVVVHASFERELDLGDNFRIERIDARPVSLKSLYGALDTLLDQVEPDLLHSTFPLVPLQWEGPTLVTIHDLQPFTVSDFTARRNPVVRLGYDLFYRWAYQHALNKAAAIVSVSHATKETLRQYFPMAAYRTLVVPLGLDTRFLRSVKIADFTNVRAKFRLPERFIHFVGSTRPNKNLPRMLAAFGEYVQTAGDDDLAFVLVVDRDRFWRECEQVIATFGLEKRVVVAEQVRTRELRNIVALSQLLFFATKSEGFGIPVLEAQASGVPVIVSTDGALPEVAGGGALTVDPDDTNAMTEALATGLADDEARAALIERGFANAQRFTWQRTARETHDIYKYLFDPRQFEVERRLPETAVTATKIGKS